MQTKTFWSNTHILDHKLNANRECNVVRDKASLLVGWVNSYTTLQNQEFIPPQYLLHVSFLSNFITSLLKFLYTIYSAAYWG